MKPFKFRVWDNQNKNFDLTDQCFISSEGRIYHKSAYICVDITDRIDIEISYSIGLFDKNDKQIFEGDVFHYGDCNYLVKYCSYSARFIMRHFDYDDEYDFNDMEDWNDVEIIGNRFENPEILDKLK